MPEPVYGGSAHHEVRIPCGQHWLYGDLTLPEGFTAIVLFCHGSGSGRHSARNRTVAASLQQHRIATLLFDLLTVEEQEVDRMTRRHRFDIALLTERLQDATLWARAQPGLENAAVGYFGASTGSAAALIAAARLDGQISAVVSRGGCVDLAGPVALAAVMAPTLLVVGTQDHGILDINRKAFQCLRCEKQLTLVPDAGHLFEEPGAIEHVGEACLSWFRTHLVHREHGWPGRTGSATILLEHAS
jgi:putative phosphoribosyl transferase